jgi:septal ring factor EnvC (AmiA/AmiB activator)
LPAARTDARRLPLRIARLAGWALAAVLLLDSSASALAASARKNTPTGAELKERKGDLGELRQRIDQLNKDLAASESARSEVADQLRDQERGISELQRELHELANQREVLHRRIAELGKETRHAEAQLGTQQSLLERMLVQQYMNGTPGPLRLLLAGESPNQTARDLAYLAAIGQARQQLAQQTAGLIDEKRRLGSAAEQESAALATLEARQKAQQEKMLAQREDRKKTLAKLAGRLESQRREIDTLRRDEQRLAKLVERLGRLIASRPKPPKVAKPPKPTKVPKSGRAESKEQGTGKTPQPEETAPAPVPDDGGIDFPDLARLKGRLPYPVSGQVAQRYGAPLDGGVRSKGIFVRAANGSAIRAIASGQVVFADWMRGFGNLMVVDHGNGFLSIYGYTESMLKDVGAAVRGGETIAGAGSSGGRSETGLYFELRRKGEPLDPGQWLRR